MIDEGRRGRKPGYIHEMGSHDLKSCEVKCQRNTEAGARDINIILYEKTLSALKTKSFKAICRF
jgi:hypothetical protein